MPGQSRVSIYPEHRVMAELLFYVLGEPGIYHDGPFASPTADVAISLEKHPAADVPGAVADATPNTFNDHVIHPKSLAFLRFSRKESLCFSVGSVGVFGLRRRI